MMPEVSGDPALDPETGTVGGTVLLNGPGGGTDES